MPLQNRVSPDGKITATPARGLLMGNRGGRIHDAAQRLGARRWATRQWICCVLSFKQRQRQVMSDGYTEVFFLDEVTALAAGHRPCFECRRAAALAFAARFPDVARAPLMDRLLHQQRLGPHAVSAARDLPDGAMFRSTDGMFAKRGDAALPWDFTGYGARAPLPADPVDVLTPAATLAVLHEGYAPLWHPSAQA